MEKIYQIELILKENLSPQELEITKRYWLLKNGVFNERPSHIADNFEIDTFNLSRIAKDNGHLEIIKECSHCNSNHQRRAYSQTAAKRYLAPSWECEDCKEKKRKEEKEKIELAEKKILKTRAEKFEQAISNKVWLEFNRQELYCLLQMLKAATAKHLIAGIKKLDDNNYWKVLHKADRFGLVDLVKHNNYYITDFFKSEEINEKVKDYFKSSPPKSESIDTPKPIHPALGFKMTKNRKIRTSDDAWYYGDISFDRDIILKAGVPYSYAVWPREDENPWLSITPSDNILKSKNIPRPNGPQIIGDIIKKWKY